MQQITDWLEKLGMSEYAQRFAENGIVSPSPAILQIRTSRTSACSAIAGRFCARLVTLAAQLR